jgi:hypothetical protein
VQEDNIFDGVFNNFRMLALELVQHTKGLLMIRRRLDDVCGEDRVDVAEHVARLKLGPDGIANLVNFAGYDRGRTETEKWE